MEADIHVILPDCMILRKVTTCLQCASSFIVISFSNRIILKIAILITFFCWEYRSASLYILCGRVEMFESKSPEAIPIVCHAGLLPVDKSLPVRHLNPWEV